MSSLSLIQHIKSFKRIYVIYSIDLDSIITSSMLLRIAKDEEIEIYLAPFYAASKLYDSEALVVLVKVFQKTPVSGLKVYQIDDILGKDPKIMASTTLYMLKELKKTLIIPRYIELLSLVAMLSISRGTVYDQNLIDLHKNIIEETVDKNLYTFIDTIRLFGYPKRDVVEALAKTIDPYVVGVSLNYEGSKKLLESIGGSLSTEEAKTKLVNALNNVLAQYNKSGVSIIGPRIVLKETDIVDDIYEAVYMLYSYFDLVGLDPLLYLCIDNKILDVIKGAYDYVSESLREIIDISIDGNIKKMIVRGVKLSLIDISSLSFTPPLYTSYRILKALGLVEDVAVFTNGKEFLLPLPFVASRWPYDKELNIEKSYVVFSSLQALGDVFK
ncbi:MAG: hypothetical protein QW111_02025 [Ignisphaera sp.]